MDAYRINFRVWAAVTAVLCSGFLAWNYWTGPQTSFLADCRRVALGTAPRPYALLEAVMAAFGLVLIGGMFVWAVCVMATQLARRLTPPPASVQDADYDDPPPAG